jgi:hypothetical protein
MIGAVFVLSAVRIERTAPPVPLGGVSADQRGCAVWGASRVQHLVEVKRRRTPIVITGVKKSRTKSLTAVDKLSTS